MLTSATVSASRVAFDGESGTFFRAAAMGDDAAPDADDEDAAAALDADADVDAADAAEDEAGAWRSV